MKTTNKHLEHINKIYPNAVSVSKPAIDGLVHDIYIVQNNDGTKFVCRFSTKKMAQHNENISKLLSDHGINVPKVSLYKTGTEYCETYPFISGKTLHERLVAGIPEAQQDKIYQQLFDISERISQIPYKNHVKPAVPITMKIATNIAKRMNCGPVLLRHNDLLAKNIILDENDNVSGLIDLDSVYPEHSAFSLIHMMQNAHLYGYDITKMRTIYQKYNIKPKFINLESQAKIYMIAKRIGKFILNEFLIKQLLKIRTK